MERTSPEELQYLVREIAREMNANLPEDLNFLLMIFHKGDGQVGWARREGAENGQKLRAVVRNWLELAEKTEVKSED